MNNVLETEDILEMCKSLVCLMSEEAVKAMLDGEGYSKIEIEEFIEYCET